MYLNIFQEAHGTGLPFSIYEICFEIYILYFAVSCAVTYFDFFILNFFVRKIPTFRAHSTAVNLHYGENGPLSKKSAKKGTR
jgi:hypothetical protein